MSSSPYAASAKVISQILAQRKGIKSIVYNKKGELTCSTATYAICCNVMKYKPVLDKIIKKKNNKASLEEELQVKNVGLLYVLLYELLLGPNRKIRGGGALKRQLLAREDTLREMINELVPNNQDLISSSSSSGNTTATSTVTIPRYVRVNTLVTTTQEVIQFLKDKKGMMTNNDNNMIYIDPHVPDLLVLPPTPESRAKLQDLVTSHRVILQDKSSCFSALCLVHGFGSRDDLDELIDNDVEYLDACAAPGNKTSHLASLVLTKNDDNNSDDSKKKKKTKKQSIATKIHALDKSKDRFEMLQRRMKELVNQHYNKNKNNTNNDDDDVLKCHLQDFLSITQQQQKVNNDMDDEQIMMFPNVRAILLDPSCSGSGMTNHLETPTYDPTFCNDRVKSLGDFQYKALTHAGTAFPNVQRIVYSTCSMYTYENEGVVARFLANNNNNNNNEWELIPPTCLETWPRRGIPMTTTTEKDGDDESIGLTKDQAKCLIRVHPGEDGTNGFFVACFQRKLMPLKKKNKKQPQQKDKMKSSPLPKFGLEYYNGQFQKKKKNNNNSNSSKSKKGGGGDDDDDGAETTVPGSSSSTKKNKKQDKKSKANNNNKTSTKTDDEAESSSTSNKKRKKASGDNENEEDAKGQAIVSSKKRAKKMEWKKKQREKKLARLQKKQQGQETEEQPSM